jgi:hypothetical protein
MAGRFIPDGNAEFAVVAQVYATNIAKDPARYGVSAQDVELLTRAERAFVAAQLHRAPRRPGCNNSRSPLEEARQKAEAIVRRLGRMIRANDQISAADKAKLFIYPRDPSPAGHGPPTTMPILTFVGATGEGGLATSGQHVIKFEQRPDLKATFRRQKKPPGVVRIELFADLVPQGQPIPEFPGQYLGGRPWYLGSFTTSPIRVFPPTASVPMLVVYWGRWADARCRVGPFSQTCRARVEGWGGIAADKLLGPMPEVRVLEDDPKYLAQLRQFEQLTMQQQHLLPEPGERPEGEKATTPKQLPPMSDAA